MNSIKKLIFILFSFYLLFFTACPVFQNFGQNAPAINAATAESFFCDLNGLGTFSDLTQTRLSEFETEEASFLYFKEMSHNLYDRCGLVHSTQFNSCMNQNATSSLEEELLLNPDFIQNNEGVSRVVGPIERMGISSQLTQSSPFAYQSYLSNAELFQTQLECISEGLPSKLRLIKVLGKSLKEDLNKNYFLDRAQKIAIQKNEKFDFFSFYFFITAFQSIFGDHMYLTGELLEEDSFSQKFKFSFGSVEKGEVRSKRFTYLVDGTQSISELTVIKPLQTSGYSIWRNTCESSLPLQPGEICEIEIQFGPMSFIGNFESQIDIIHPYLEDGTPYISSIQLKANSIQPVEIPVDDHSCSTGFECGFNEVCSFGTCQSNITHQCFIETDCGMNDCIDGHCQ